jgi:hypothetical protein
MVLYSAEGEALYLGDYDGQVIDVADPLDIGRVKVVVPGLLEAPGAWAFPIGGAHSTGGKNVGGYDVPPKGATVKVSFSGGNIDNLEYKGGFHGKGEQLSVKPSDFGGAAGRVQADKLKVFESARFLIVLNGIGNEEEVLIKDKTTGDQISMKPDRTLVKATAKVTVVAPQIELGADGLGNAPLLNGVVLGSGIDTFTGAQYGALGSASSVVTAKKT